jgi:hypothetical protein
MARGEQVYSTQVLHGVDLLALAEMMADLRSQCCQLRQVYHIALVRDTGI